MIGMFNVYKNGKLVLSTPNIVRRQRRYMEGEGGTPPAGGTPPPAAGKVFDQKAVDEVVGKVKAEMTKKFDQERMQTLDRLKALETDAAKVGEYEKQIEELNLRYKSKEELALDAYKKERATWEERAKKADEEKTSWQKKWQEQTRDRDLMLAATDKELDVKSSEQMLMILQPKARVVQKVVEGKPIDDYETRVLFDTTKEGKRVQLDLLPNEAIKLMKSDVARFGNLFNSGATGGLGGSGPAGAPGNDTLMGLSQEEFTKRYLEGTLPKRVK